MASNEKGVGLPQDTSHMVTQPVATVVLAAKDLIRINGDLYYVQGISPLFLVQYKDDPPAEETSSDPSALKKHQGPAPNPYPVTKRDDSVAAPMSPRGPQFVHDTSKATEDTIVVGHTSSTPSVSVASLSSALKSAPIPDSSSGATPDSTPSIPPTSKPKCHPLPDRRPLSGHNSPSVAPTRLTKLVTAREFRDDAKVTADISATAERNARAAAEKAVETAHKLSNVTDQAEHTVKSIHFTRNEVKTISRKIKAIVDHIEGPSDNNGHPEEITRKTMAIVSELHATELKALDIMDEAQEMADEALRAVGPARAQEREASIRTQSDNAALRLAEQKYRELAQGNGVSTDDNRPWGCKICGQNYTNRRGLQNHNCKPQDWVAQGTAEVPSRFPCQSASCKKSFRTMRALEEHYKVCGYRV